MSSEELICQRLVAEDEDAGVDDDDGDKDEMLSSKELICPRLVAEDEDDGLAMIMMHILMAMMIKFVLSSGHLSSVGCYHAIIIHKSCSQRSPFNSG